MKYFQWTIGSTTVRNPDRLREGLIILKNNFNGCLWDLAQQEKFFDLLVEQCIYETEESNYIQMTSARKQEHARKWISVLNQLGFCFAYQSSGKPVMISKSGEALINNPGIEEEIFLRQLLKYQKPCALPKQHGETFQDVSVLPFIVSLKITYVLQGISKEEISIFLNTTIRMGKIDGVIAEIKDYRSRKKEIEGSVRRKQFYVDTQLTRLKMIFKEEIDKREQIITKLFTEFKKSAAFLSTKEGKQLLAEIVKAGKGSNTKKAQETKINIINALKNNDKISDIKKIFLDYYLFLKLSTLKDYADLTARYLRKSGLFSINGNKLVIIKEKTDFIKDLLMKNWKLTDDIDYFDYLWSDIKPSLPTDSSDYLINHLKVITQKEKQLFENIGDSSMNLIGQKILHGKSILDLKRQAKEIETNMLCLKEVEFYRSQSSDEQINDILNFYDLIKRKEILGGEAYYPAYLEWNTWRVFLAINTLLNKPYEARGFKIDDELQPIHHAPGGNADMIFKYNDFILAVEVTLNTKANQWSAEAEPVPRHIAKIQFDNKNKKVFGIFIAPEIDINTVLTFFNTRKYFIDKESIDLTIVPLTLDQIIYLLKVFQLKRFSVDDIKKLLEGISQEMNELNDAIIWHAKIPHLITDWEIKL